MDENYCALALAILGSKPLTPEMAFDCLSEGRMFHRSSWKRLGLTPEDTVSMVKMRETMTYREIAASFGCDPKAVFSRVKRYLEATQH